MAFFAPEIFASRDTSSRRVLSLLDPAVDLDATMAEHGLEYQTSHKRRHVVLRPGQTPSEFEIVAISVEEADHIRATADSVQDEFLRMYQRAALRLHGVRRGEGDEEHSVIVSGADMARVPFEVKIEIGGYIKRISEYAPRDFFSPSSPSSSTAEESSTD